MSEHLFNESWYQVADLRLRLLPSVRISKQKFRGEIWYVLRDCFNDRFFRIRPEAYRFLMRLEPKFTVEEIWEKSLEVEPKTSPRQGEVIRLLAQLHASNLLYFLNPPDNIMVFERVKKTRKKEIRSKFLSFLFVRIPLWDPESWLQQVQPLTKILCSKTALLLWFFVIIAGIFSFVGNLGQAGSQAQGLLAPDNLILLYISIFILRVFHEFGHVMVCHRFGGSVHVMGIMLLILTPLPYMDASASWSFRSRWQRALVGAAGMMVDLFGAAIAAIVWVNTGDGILHSIAFNIMVVGSVSSLVFNGNPLLRFDAYYILSDVLEIPNLYQRAINQWYYWIELYCYGLEDLSSPGSSQREILWLASYAVASFLYRLMITIGIVFFVADQWFFLGVIVAFLMMYMWLFKPLGTFFIYLLSSPKLDRHRYRAMVVSSFFIISVLLIVGWIPFSHAIKSPGVVVMEPYSTVYAPAQGYLDNIVLEAGEHVQKGDFLLQMSNEDVRFDIANIQSHILENNVMKSSAFGGHPEEIKPVLASAHVLRNKLDKLLVKQQDLHVVAGISGVWISDPNTLLIGKWYQQGEELGTVVSTHSARFSAVVSQEEAAELFDVQLQSKGVRLQGLSDQIIQVKNVHMIPVDRNELPSAVLGWLGGGHVAVSEGGQGRATVESFFEVSAELVFTSQQKGVYHGRSGLLYLRLTDKTLFNRFLLYVDQLMQKRYQL